MNWDYQLEQKTDEAHEFALSKLDRLSPQEMIEEATRLGLLEVPEVLDRVEQLLYNHYYWEAND